MAKQKTDHRDSGSGVATSNFFNCECCDPVNNLFPRPDLAGVVDEGTQIAKVALCILHKPQPSVYVWNTELEKYELRQDLHFSEQQIKKQDGSLAFTSPSSIAPSVLEVDDEEEKDKKSKSKSKRDAGGPKPTGDAHVDLSKDGFWSSRK